jgi:hypothetical protein
VTDGPSHATPQPEAPAPAQAPAAVAPVPAAPVPLVVGHAEDHAEHEADAMADSALARLRRVEGGEEHTHGPGCDHSSALRASVQRSTAPPTGAAVVGREGGALDDATTTAIAARRGGGRPLEGDVRRRMESAFSRSFSGVRIHDDAGAARLSSSISASAFTTGKDIFFGHGQYQPGSPGGERMLAHELAHTLQPGTAPARSLDPRTRAAVGRGVATAQVINRWDWWDKRKARKAEEAQAAKQKKDNSKYDGPAGKESSAAVEFGKPAGAMAAVGGVMLGTMLGGVAGGGETLPGILAGDTSAGLKGGFGMAEDAKEFGDAGMANLAERKKKAQGMGLAGASISAAGAGTATAFMKGTNTLNVWDAAKTGADATLGTAAGAIGVAGGSVQVLQGAWKGGKAIMKLCRLAWGRAKTMLSKRGEGWKKDIVRAEKYKAVIAAAKMALGALGIAAGALLIVSNPIGWGIGLAAAIAGGVYAATKIAGKVKNTYDRNQAAKKLLADEKPFDDIGTGPTRKGIGDRLESTEAGLDWKDNKGFQKDYGTAADDVGKTPRQKSRSEAIAEANKVGREASANAVLADDLRSALSQGDKGLVEMHLENAEKVKNYPMGQAITNEVDRELHDAFLLLSSINVDPEEALAESGQELIEKKLSKVEAM